ncbi:MurR/RpiR family transcriptional regulator [Shinella zoogloeoides]|uniref:MurR/RpiR family transcriptional regulator n=1 Tax=Shinella zoogloeoides TaxID=352475 RepID=UPI000E655F77|nr:MurR/RpiR family transcriptional regulator [Shinella zoogloeoides]
MPKEIQMEELHKEILDRYDQLSNRLQLAARYTLEHPNEVALETITELAKRANVQPSVFVRLSQAFGFSGFSEFQKVFQGALARQAPSYGERIRLMRKVGSETSRAQQDIPTQFIDINRSSLGHLAESLDYEAFRKAVDLINGTEHLHVIGQRRSHALAIYLSYAFTRSGRNARLLSGAGGTLADDVKIMKPADVLIAISMHPYSPETVETVDHAIAVGTPVVAITDGPLSPIARGASAVLEVRDVDFLGFRSIVAQVCLSQALIIAVAEAAARGQTPKAP